MRALLSASVAALMMAPTATAQPPEIHQGAISTLAEDLAAPAPVTEPAPVVAEPQDDGVLDLAELGDMRGGINIGVQGTTQTLTATNSGNTVTGQTIGSGDMNINANAFNGYDGIGNFVINTGHNNNLMGSVAVNVMVVPQ